MAMSFLKPYVNIRTKNFDSNFQPVVQQTLSSPCQEPCSIPFELATDDLTELPVGHESISQTEVSPPLEIIENVQKDAQIHPSKKRSYASMSQKQLDRALDVKIIEYISDSKKKSLQDHSPMVTVEDAFGKSVAAQLNLLDKEAKSIAMGKIQMVLSEASTSTVQHQHTACTLVLQDAE